MGTTWDGQPIASQPPRGATVVVFRRGHPGVEVLVLHRAHEGPEFDGDWAWTPPAGARLPGESLEVCARRELVEETGLELPLTRTACGTPDWPVFVAEAPAAVDVQLDAEPDRYGWYEALDAVLLVAPARARDPLRAACELIRGVTVPWYGDVCPLAVDETVELFADFPRRWWIAGGVAIDLATGTVRDHR